MGVLCEQYYLAYGRRFFWRIQALTPFQVLVVEFLLWKTRAENVEKYGKQLVMNSSTPQDLLDIPPGVIKSNLKPLGLYNRRTRLLIKIATILVEKYGGKVPRDASSLLSLPGVGPYVASATLLFAYGEPFLPLDKDVERYLTEHCGHLEFSASDRRYPLNKSYLDFSRKFFSKVKNPRYAGWGILDKSKVKK